jgi:hypothetical protein
MSAAVAAMATSETAEAAMVTSETAAKPTAVPTATVSWERHAPHSYDVYRRQFEI